MNAAIQSAAVGLGAAIGANLRYWVGVAAGASAKVVWPWPTLVINVTGSLFLGVVTALAERQGWSLGWKLFLGVGVAGGYTTFSTFSREAFDLLAAGRTVAGLGYMAASLCLCVAGYALGYLLPGWLGSR